MDEAREEGVKIGCYEFVFGVGDERVQQVPLVGVAGHRPRVMGGGERALIPWKGGGVMLHLVDRWQVRAVEQLTADGLDYGLGSGDEAAQGRGHRMAMVKAMAGAGAGASTHAGAGGEVCWNSRTGPDGHRWVLGGRVGVCANVSGVGPAPVGDRSAVAVGVVVHLMRVALVRSR